MGNALIQILNNQVKELLEDCSSFKNTISVELKTDLPKDTITDINLLLSDSSILDFCNKVTNKDFYQNLTYQSLAEVYATVEILKDKLEEIKESVDIEIFLKEGYRLDQTLLEEKYKGEVKKRNPNFNIPKLCELYANPPKEIPTYYDENLKITIDPFPFRKFLIGFMQMVYNNMDLIIAYTGSEGSGKSNKCSQDMYMEWIVLTELGLIDYPFQINEIFISTLSKFRETEDKYFNSRFRIIGLDEGNELNRQNWKEPEVATFFQRLRRERHNQRIKHICIPVIGEMIPNIVLSRVNFIFEMEMQNATKTGTLNKGDVNFYIIPRTEKIYSPYFKKELSRGDIKNKFYEKLKDKSYLSGMPEGILIKRFRSNGVWGFKESDYEKNLKDTNETFTVNKGLTLTETEMFYLYKTNIKLKKLGIKPNDIRYHSSAKIFIKIKNYFEKNPDLMLKYEAIYKRKLEERALDSEEVSEEDLEDDVTDLATKLKEIPK